MQLAAYEIILMVVTTKSIFQVSLMWIVGRKAFLFGYDHRLFAMVFFETMAGNIVVILLVSRQYLPMFIFIVLTILQL